MLAFSLEWCIAIRYFISITSNSYAEYHSKTMPNMYILTGPLVTGGLPPGERCFDISKTAFQRPPKLDLCLEFRNEQEKKIGYLTLQLSLELMFVCRDFLNNLWSNHEFWSNGFKKSLQTNMISYKSFMLSLQIHF